MKKIDQKFHSVATALFTFRFRIIIVTEGSFSLTVSCMQCNKRKTKNTLQVRKCLASKETTKDPLSVF